ncbi:MAG TPA: RnfH family protein [Steroidobacteraceae bacterium]|nr:RnfH family protein [Steroidobacteraceae bacterium]
MKHCTVVCDTAQGLTCCELSLPDGADVAQALALAAAQQQLPPEALDWQGAAVGIYGQLCTRAHVPADGDRIELYRPLPADPRAVRRARLARRAVRLRTARGT